MPTDLERSRCTEEAACCRRFESPDLDGEEADLLAMNGVAGGGGGDERVTRQGSWATMGIRQAATEWSSRGDGDALGRGGERMWIMGL